ncbi:MAG: LppA family lipoprotein, partial [Dermatophilaceae bacterium]
TTSGDPMDARKELMTRPSFEHAEQQYLDLLTRVRAAIDTRAPGLDWAEPQPSRAERGGCGRPFHLLNGVYSGIYKAGGRGARNPIDDATWPELQAAIQAIVADQGFTQLTVIQDVPGHHEIAVKDPDTGAVVQLGTQLATTLTLYGGCFLPDAARSPDTPTETAPDPS